MQHYNIYKIQETLFNVDFQMYNRIKKKAAGYFVDNMI